MNGRLVVDTFIKSGNLGNLLTRHTHSLVSSSFLSQPLEIKSPLCQMGSY